MSKKNTQNPPQLNPQEGQAAAAESLKYGNRDTDQKHDISKLKVPAGFYVVRHYGTIKLQNGQEMEDPTSSRFQVYDAETFKNMSEQKVKDGKQMPSQFQLLGLNVDVLHEPE